MRCYHAAGFFSPLPATIRCFSDAIRLLRHIDADIAITLIRRLMLRFTPLRLRCHAFFRPRRAITFR